MENTVSQNAGKQLYQLRHYSCFYLVSEDTWFHGPWFISPADTQHLPTRMFYEKEVFLSSLEETIPVGNIAGKCCVLPFREYVRCESFDILFNDAAGMICTVTII